MNCGPLLVWAEGGTIKRVSFVGSEVELSLARETGVRLPTGFVSSTFFGTEMS